MMRACGRDWFVVDWIDVWAKLRLPPHAIPGVQRLATVNGTEPSDRPPFPHRVHLTHLRMLGFEGEALCQPITGESYLHFVGALERKGLRAHQVAGIGYIQSRRGTLLADEQRVGKTATIMYAHDSSAGCLFVVGPLAARAVWHEWAARRFGACFDGNCSICKRVGTAEARGTSFIALGGRKLDEEQLWIADKARVVFVHFAVIPTWRALFADLKIGTLVVDECHLAGIQNRDGATVESIRFVNTAAKRAVFASGTPLVNKPKGLWPILDILAPAAFGSFWQYAKRYCNAQPTAHGWQAKGASNMDELQTRLREIMLRRTWCEIAPNLPPVTRSIEIVRLGDDKRDEVEALAARIRASGGNTKTAVGDLARLRKLYAQEKIDFALQVARQLVAQGPLILWTWHRDVADHLAKRLRNDSGLRVDGPITGETPLDERERIVEEARSAFGPCVLIATMGALSTAVNLSFAKQQIFVELDWNPHFIAQAEMRPFDGVNPISSTYLVADCDVDQKLADALLAKLATMDQLGLSAGVGSVGSVLRESLGIADARTLDALADAVIAEVSQ
jgi:SNF2-related domain